MKKISLSIIFLIMFLLVFSAISTTVISEPPVKKMDPNNGEVQFINGTLSSRNLDGLVFGSDLWNSSDFVGNVNVAKDPNPVAEVYMIVEGNDNGTYEFLWIGVDMISDYYLEPTNGQWLRIDWDQDGILDFEDHTGWKDSHGKDNKSGVEWKIPWGQVRVNPSKTPWQMNHSIINHSFDILIHIEVFGYCPNNNDHNGNEDDDLDDDVNKTKKDNKGQDMKENKSKPDKNDKNDNKENNNENKSCNDTDDDTNDIENNETDDNDHEDDCKNETSRGSATFPGRPNAGPFKSTTVKVWHLATECNYDDDDSQDNNDDDVYDPDDEENQNDEDDNETDDEDDCIEKDKNGKNNNDNKEDKKNNKNKNNKDKNNSSNGGNGKGKDNKTNDEDDPGSKDKLDKKSDGLGIGKFSGKYLDFEYNLSAEELYNVTIYDVKLFDYVNMENTSFSSQKISNHLFKGDGSGGKLLAHDNPVALIQLHAKTDITVYLSIDNNWTINENGSNLSLTLNNFTINIRMVGKPGSKYLEINDNNSEISILLVKSSQLKIKLHNLKGDENKSNESGSCWFEESCEFIFDNIGFGVLGVEATITGPSDEPNVQINTYIDGFTLELEKVENQIVSFTIVSNNPTARYLLVSVIKDTLIIPENSKIEISIGNIDLTEVEDINQLATSNNGYYRVNDEEGEQILISVSSEIANQQITMQFLPGVGNDGSDIDSAIDWGYLDFASVIGILIVVLIAGLYLYVVRRED